MQTIRAGTILIQDHLQIAQHLAIESKPYAANWSVVEGSEGMELDRKIHASGWNFFFLAGELRATFFGAPDAKNFRTALKRMLSKASKQNFNCLEVTAIASRQFAGLSRTVISAHRRHIQENWQLDRAERRAENARVQA